MQWQHRLGNGLHGCRRAKKYEAKKYPRVQSLLSGWLKVSVQEPMMAQIQRAETYYYCWVTGAFCVAAFFFNLVSFPYILETLT